MTGIAAMLMRRKIKNESKLAEVDVKEVSVMEEEIRSIESEIVSH